MRHGKVEIAGRSAGGFSFTPHFSGVLAREVGTNRFNGFPCDFA
jgi:hypothetical protein